MTAAAALPPLRDELTLHRSGRADDGEPNWVIHDPVANRYFRLGWFEFEVLSRWSLGSAEEIAQQINGATLLETDAAQVEEVLQFLATHNLLQVRGDTGLQRLVEQEHAARRGTAGWWLKNYLFVRFPLVRPDAFLERTLPWVEWLWSPRTLVVLALAALLGLYLVVQQWETFLATFPHLFSLEGMLTVAAALVVTKMLHELGHGYTAKRYGCRVPTMGVAFLVLWPVLYTDSTDAWRLGSRQQRLAIASAGIVVELGLAVVATLLWSFLDDGPLRSAVFLVATTTWVLTLLVNLNPFMRFDGYYLLSDFLGIANLQDRAFQLGRWRLREWLFGFGEPPPERLPRQRLLIAYAYGTWIYRFFLFLGIALLVYYFFFKALGIFLMLVELAWFIGRPILNEFKAWHERRHWLRVNVPTMRTGLLLLGLLGLLCYPWQGWVSAPAVWRVEDSAQVYASRAGRVVQVHAELGATVAAGAELVTLESPDRQHEIQQGERRIRTLRWQLEFASVSPELRERATILRQELASEQAAQSERLREQEGMTLTAPIDGTLVDQVRPLSAGDWLPEDAWVATLVAPDAGKLESYVDESDSERFAEGTKGQFYPRDFSREPFDVVVRRIDRFSTQVLTEPHLASVFGGGLAVRENADGELIPENTLYRVVLAAPTLEGGPRHVVAGEVRIRGERRSIIGGIWRRVVAVLVRESSF